MSIKTLAGISAAAILSILAGNAYAEQMYVNKLGGAEQVPAATYGSIEVSTAFKATAYTARTEINTNSDTANMRATWGGSLYIATHTISAWYKIDSLPTSGDKMIYANRTATTGNWGGYMLAVTSEGKLKVGRANTSNFTFMTGENVVTYDTSIAAGDWYYITVSMTHGDSACTPVITVNGTTVSTASGSPTTIPPGMNGNRYDKFEIGAGVSAAGLYVDTDALDGAATTTLAKATSEDCVSPATRESVELYTVTIDTETELDLSTITLPEDKDVMNIKVVVPAEKAITITGTKPAAVPGALQIEVNGVATMTPALSATLGAVTGTGTLKIANANTGTSSSQHPSVSALAEFTGTIEIAAGRIEALSNFSHAGMTIKVDEGAQLSTGGTGAWTSNFVLSGSGWTAESNYAISGVSLRAGNDISGEIAAGGDGVVTIGVYGGARTVSGKVTAPNGLKVIADSSGKVTLSNGSNALSSLEVTHGTVIGGAANALGSGEITVRTGASVVTQQYAGNTGYSVTLDGGTLKSKGAGDAHGKLVKNLTLTKDSSYIWADEGAGSGLIGVGNGGANNDAAKTSINLDGHTLTLTGKDANTRVYLDKTTIASAGTINVTQGRLFLHCSNIEMPEGSKLVIGESASIEADTVTLTVPELVYNGTATSESSDMCNVTVTDKYSGTGTIPKLTLADGATIEVAEVPEDKVVVKASNTLTANVATLQFMVGGEASELMLEKVGNTIVAREAGGTYDCETVTSARSETGCWYDGHNTDKWTINVPAFTGYLPNGAHIYATLNLGGNWTINDGYNGSTATIDKLTGEGNLTVSKDFGEGKSYTVIINDLTAYTGEITIGGTVVIKLPNSYTADVEDAVAKKVGETMTEYFSTVDLALKGKTPGDNVSDVTILDTDATLPAAWDGYKVDADGNIVAKTATDLFLEGIAAGGEVTLTSDIEISETIVVDGAVTLNLGTSTITSTVAPLFKVTGSLTINGGTLAGPTGSDGAALDGESMINVVGGTLIYNSGTLTCGGSGSDGMYGVSVHDEGVATFGTSEGGPSISSHFAAVGANNTTAPVTITINNGSYTSAATTDNALWFYFCAAVYAPGSGDITINGGTFSGKYGVYTRYSNVEQNLTINRGTFNSTATDIGIDTKTGTGYVGSGIRTITIGANELSIPEGYIVSEGKVIVKPVGPTSWDDIKEGDDVTTIITLPEGQEETSITATELKAWAEKTGATFGETIPVNALILNCAPDAELLEDVQAAADEILEDYLEEATKEVDLATLLKEIPEGGKEISIEGYPMATIKLVPATLGEGVTTSANLFKLELKLK